jgi:hypothetical protein
MTDSHQSLEEKVAGFVTGERPAASASFNGFFHYSSSDSSIGVLTYCNGVAWFDVTGFGSVVALDGSSSNGAAVTGARSDHKHSFATGAVSTAAIADGAITRAKLEDGVINGAKLDTGAVSAVHYSASSINSSAIAADAVTSAKILNYNVTVDKIAADAVTSAKILDTVIRCC